MSTTIFPVSGSFGGRKSQPVRRPDAPQSSARVQAAAVNTKRAGWTHFAKYYATWATAGRLPLSQ
jgi:hypothetical protein